MNKRTISATFAPHDGATGEWLALTEQADVELTSEDPTHPIDAALAPDSGDTGWRAASRGEQLIRLTFKEPLPLRLIRVVFEEHERARTQQFVLRVATAEGAWREVARQQFNFSPGGATREEEVFRVNVPAAHAMELTIVPDISGGDARASLRELRVA